MLSVASNAQFNNNSGNNSSRAPGQPGLTAEYFSDQGSFTSRIDPTLAPSLVLPTGMDVSQGYTVVWSGYLQVVTSGTYTVTMDLGNTTSQFSTVSINGNPVTRYNTTPFGAPSYSNSIVLTAGHTYPIVVNAQLVGTGTWSPRAFITQGSTNTTLTSANFTTAIVPSTPVDTVTYVAPDGATSAWTISDTPASINIYRYPVGTISGIYASPIINEASTASTYTDNVGQEGVDTEYDLKEVYNNPVTGGQTSGPATGSDVTMPFQIMNNPVNTGSGKVTLFFSAPPTTVSFRIFMDDNPGTPTNLLAAGPTSQFQDTRYGQTNSYMVSKNGLTVNKTEYYTIQALNGNGNVLHTSEQVDWETLDSGFPWDGPITNIASTIGGVFTNLLGFGSLDYLDVVSPNKVLFSVTGQSTATWQLYEPHSPDYLAPSHLPVTPTMSYSNLDTQFPVTMPVKGTAGGPFVRFESLPGYTEVLSSLNIPPLVDSSGLQDFVRGIHEGVKADAFDLYEGGDIDGGAVDAGLSYDTSAIFDNSNPPKQIGYTLNNFWSPIINVSPRTGTLFWDGNLPVGPPNSVVKPGTGQFNGKVRIHLPTDQSQGFNVYMDFKCPVAGTAQSPNGTANGYMSLFFDLLNGTSLCDNKGNSLAGSKFAICGYQQQFRYSKAGSMRVKVTSSIAQGNTGGKSYLSNGSIFRGWNWGDASGYNPIYIGTAGGIYPWTSDLHGVWACSPSYGNNFDVIQPVQGITSYEFINLFDWILTSP